jgi:hypothetical protein
MEEGPVFLSGPVISFCRAHNNIQMLQSKGTELNGFMLFI